MRLELEDVLFTLRDAEAELRIAIAEQEDSDACEALRLVIAALQDAIADTIVRITFVEIISARAVSVPVKRRGPSAPWQAPSCRGAAFLPSSGGLGRRQDRPSPMRSRRWPPATVKAASLQSAGIRNPQHKPIRSDAQKAENLGQSILPISGAGYPFSPD